MRIVRRISAVIIGFVFFITGLLKLMDPVGTGLIVDEYLSFFHLSFLRFADLYIAVAIALTETVLGAALITGVWKKIVGVLTGIMLGGFTIITAILLIVNPNMDCGCFGEALHLSHLQSFLKNIALLILWALSFIPFKEQEPTRRIKYVSFSISAISVCFFLLYSLLSIPMVDFTPYKAGAELMSEESLLTFSDLRGEYVDSLAMGQRVVAVSAYSPSSIKEEQWDKISTLLGKAENLGYTSLLLIASTPDFVEELPSELQPYVYFADRKVLMTLNRSNLGLSYFSDGQIIAKWSAHKHPSAEKLSEIYSKDSTEVMIEQNNPQSLRLQAFLLYVFAVMLLL